MKNTKKKSLPRRIAGKAYRTALNMALDLYSCRNFMAERNRSKKKQKGHKIRVGFIVQYIPAWNKTESLYELLKSDDQFETFLLCVQNGIKDGILLDISWNGNDVYDWFVGNGYAEAINTYCGNEKWLDLKELNLDYIFYPRPYNNFMPRQYWSRYVSAYTKICSILYGSNLTVELMKVAMNRDFFRNVSYYFADSQDAKLFCEKRFKKFYRLKFMKSVNVGFPFISQMMSAKAIWSESWNFSHGECKVMWTPRWTTDLNVGGSNFFTYKDIILDFAEKNTEFDFLLRPHPLMFAHFIETGELSEHEKEGYEKRIRGMKNVEFDYQKEYSTTFWNSDILVSDISGMLPEYFITGKPIIFCATNFVLHAMDFTKKMLSGCYIANSADELCKYLLQLKKGDDPLRTRREEIINDIFRESTKPENMIISYLK